MKDRELKSVALAFRKGIIGKKESDGWCACVSWPLQAWLRFLGVASESVEVDLGRTNHVFLKLADGRILDPTADQFGGPKVYLGPPLRYHQNQKPKENSRASEENNSTCNGR